MVKMKKVILMVILFSKAIIADDGTMTISGNILPSATVGFDAIIEDLTDNKLFFKGKNIHLGSIPLGGHIANVTQNIYVKTNIGIGIKMKISDPKPSFKGSLVNSTNDDMIRMEYDLMGLSYNMSSSPFVSLSNTRIIDGTSSIGTFVIKQYTDISNTQMPDTYSATFDVTIASN
jgi:hypothetical protein